jgi:hypothetical protein
MEISEVIEGDKEDIKTSFSFELTSRDYSFNKTTNNEGSIDSLEKWGLSPRLSLACLRISGRKFDKSEAQAFLLDLFSSSALYEALNIFDKSGKSIKLKPSSPSTLNPASLEFEELISTATSMTFFDRLIEAGAVHESGSIKKRMDEDFYGVTICDCLREALICPEEGSMIYSGLFTENEKKELLYKLLKFITTGGPLCQHEDTWDAYLETTRSLYKDLVVVTKANDGKTLNVVSSAFLITRFDGLFPTDNPHSVCIVSVDPIRRIVTILMHTFLSSGW